MTATPFAWRIDTTASASWSLPFECPLTGIWNNNVGVQKTLNVEGVWNGAAVPNDDEIWVELEYLSDASSPQGSFVDDGKANLLASAAAQATSVAVWGAGSVSWSLVDRTNNFVLTNNNLTATAGVSSAAGRANAGIASGKRYFEVTMPTWSSANSGPGLALASVTLSSWANNVAGIAYVTLTGGTIYINGSNSGSSLGTRGSGDVIGIAVDRTANLIWFRVAPSGNWNGSGAADPATGAGGISISAISGTLFPGVFLALAGENGTINFGASAFTGTAPSGFTATWPAAVTPFKLSADFTAQQAGFVYAKVKVGRALSTFYIDPEVTLS